MNGMEEIIRLFPGRIQAMMRELELQFEYLQEVRLRVNQPMMLQYHGKMVFLQEHKEPYLVSARDIRDTMEAVGRYSLYAYEDELRQGFLTLQGGHRVGVAGKIILEGDKVKSIKHISFVNLRLSHQVKGCADPVMPFMYGRDGQVCHTLIISPPRCGKTTLLRDLIRQISDGGYEDRPGFTVGVVDERSELAGCYQGIPANDVGVRTDVLDCCPKVDGMMMLIRSMSPDVVAVDEIGSLHEICAIDSVLRCGCKLLATVHGNSLEDVRRKPLLEKLLKEQVFERYVILGGRSLGESEKEGRIYQVLDEQGGLLYPC